MSCDRIRGLMASDAETEPQVYLYITIEIRSEFPTEDDRKLRREIEDLLESRGIGEVDGSGGGMGEMGIDLVVQDGESAQAAIQQLFGIAYPDLKYRVELSEGDEDFEMTDDDFSARRSPAQIVVGILILALAAYGVWILVDRIF